MRRASSERGPTRATAAGAVGNVIEWYDFAVFGASVTLLAAVLTPGGESGLTGVFGVFALAFLVRPLGAVVIGAYADRTGRRDPLAAALLLMTVATAAVGLLPTWAAMGAAATALLLVLRALQGFSSGGELVVSISYLVEHAPEGRRGRSGGLHMATMALGFAAGMGTVAVLQRLLGGGTMAAWGWRLPFLLALPLGLVAVYLRWRTDETPAFQALAPSTGRWFDPVIAAWNKHRETVVGGFLVAAAFTSSFNLWFVFVPSRLTGDGVHDLSTVLGGALVGLATMAVSAVLCGQVSDRVGRRPVLMAGLGGVAGVWLLGYPWVVDGSVATLVLADLAMGVALGAFVLQSALADRLPATVRTSGMAVSVGLASATVGGTAPLVASVLVSQAAVPMPAYALVWLLSASVAAARWSGKPDVSEPGGRAGAPVSPSSDGTPLAEV